MSQQKLKPTATPEKAFFNARRLVADSKKNRPKGKQTQEEREEQARREAQKRATVKAAKGAVKGTGDLMRLIGRAGDDLTR
ncbi:hypothetical protein [Oceaniglobus indicus]|uniref:hypothetical protein n=1 Tax=Oceaniglobus indicus TaxID=2047749 RepID=UPI000C18F496|nr:hypothetical protein [Oceaniglobus indicus]